MAYVYLQKYDESSFTLRTMPTPGLIDMILLWLAMKIDGIDAVSEAIDNITSIFEVDLSDISASNPVLTSHFQHPIFFVPDSRITKMLEDDWFLASWEIGVKPSVGAISLHEYHWNCSWEYVRDLPTSPPPPPGNLEPEREDIALSGFGQGAMGAGYFDVGGRNIGFYHYDYYDGIYTAQDCKRIVKLEDWSVPLHKAHIPSFDYNDFEFVVADSDVFSYYLKQSLACDDPRSLYGHDLSEIGGDWADNDRLDSAQMTGFSYNRHSYRIGVAAASHTDVYVPYPELPVFTLPFLMPSPFSLSLEGIELNLESFLRLQL